MVRSQHGHYSFFVNIAVIGITDALSFLCVKLHSWCCINTYITIYLRGQSIRERALSLLHSFQWTYVLLCAGQALIVTMVFSTSELSCGHFKCKTPVLWCSLEDKRALGWEIKEFKSDLLLLLCAHWMWYKYAEPQFSHLWNVTKNTFED